MPLKLFGMNSVNRQRVHQEIQNPELVVRNLIIIIVIIIIVIVIIMIIIIIIIAWKDAIQDVFYSLLPVP